MHMVQAFVKVLANPLTYAVIFSQYHLNGSPRITSRHLQVLLEVTVKPASTDRPCDVLNYCITELASALTL